MSWHRGLQTARPGAAAKPKLGGSSATGGLSLGSMPTPDQLGPFGAHLVGDQLGWCTGRIFFAGGSEVALVAEPQLLEVVRTQDVPALGLSGMSLGGYTTALYASLVKDVAFAAPMIPAFEAL